MQPRPDRVGGATPPRYQGPSAARKSCACEQELGFLQEIQQAAKGDLPRCYRHIVTAFQNLIPSKLVSLWAFSPLKEKLSLLAASDGFTSTRHVLEARKALSGITIDRDCVTEFDLTDPEPGKKWNRPSAKLALPEITTQRGLKRMISVPIPILPATAISTSC